MKICTTHKLPSHTFAPTIPTLLKKKINQTSQHFTTKVYKKSQTPVRSVCDLR